MTSKERIQTVLSHKEADRVTLDLGATTVTGMHCIIVEKLREYYGLEKRPVRIVDPFQMLGEVDDELLDILGIDTIPVWGRKNIFDIDEAHLHEQLTPWGQKVLVAEGIDFTPDEEGDIYIYAGNDRSYPPSAVMPDKCYFVNAIERQEPIDDDNLNSEDNLEEYGAISNEDLAYLKHGIEKAAESGKAVVAGLGGAGLGDVAFVPGMGLKDPKGIRSVVEWYMSTAMRQEYIHQVFERQIDMAIANYQKIWDAVGGKLDVVFTCGTDFGSQESQFCSLDTFRELWLPHYKKMNDWIHQHTTWKVFKHSCGAIVPILPGIVEAGFDIINPVQINAKDMDPTMLKKEYGKQLSFWGGGVDTQKILPFGKPGEVHDHVMRQCDILGKDGGFVFNTVHNIQANVPIENVVAMIDALNEIRRR